MGPKTTASTARHSVLDFFASGAADPPGGVQAGGQNGDGVVATVDFAQVYEKYFDFVWRSLRLLGVAPDAIEDAAQDTFSVVSLQLASFEGRSSLRTWLFAIARRVAANHRRLQRRKLERFEPLDESLVGSHATAQTQVETAEVLSVVQAFCESLEDDWRSVFVLSLWEETPAPEVARELGLPLNTVYSRVRSLRDGLRRALASRGGRHDKT